MIDEVTIKWDGEVTFHVGDVIGDPDSEWQHEIVRITEMESDSDHDDVAGYWLHVRPTDGDRTKMWAAAGQCVEINNEENKTQILHRADE